MSEISILAIDLAKGSFQVCGVKADGAVVFKKSVLRPKLYQLLADHAHCAVAMEACATSHHRGRVAQSSGHEVIADLGVCRRIAYDLEMHEINYVYSAHSAFAYLGSAKLSKICLEHHVTLVHKPIALSHVVEAQGSKPFRERTQAHVDYFFGREIERWAEYRGVPIISFRPTYHDADYSLASGLILALGESGEDVDKMAHALLEAHWRYDADLSDADMLSKICADLGHDPLALMVQASSEAVQDQLKENSIWARERDIFGSPTYIVNGDPFYGQDHLELVSRALSHPFSASNWRNPAVG